MEIILAKTAGFCMGVRRALDMVIEAAKPDAGPLTTIGPLVHNPQVVELLKLREVLCAGDADEVESGTAVIRSHGVPPQVEERLLNRGLNLLDATCPKVKAVQKVIAKHADEGRDVIIVGDREHPEVQALLAYAGDRGRVVAGPDELPDPLPGPAILVAQTTQDLEVFAAVERRAMELSGGEILVRNTICDSTRSRQDEVREMSSAVDAMVVVGGRNSGNTRRLAAIAAERVRTFHIEDAIEVGSLDLSGVERLGVTAGASTPSWVIEQVMERLRERAGIEGAGSMSRLWLAIQAVARAAVFSGLLSGAAAAALSIVFFRATRSRIDAGPVFLAFSFVIFMHLLNRLTNVGLDRFRDEPARHRFMIRWRRQLWALCVLSGLAAFAVAAFLGWPSALAVFFTSALGFVYFMPAVPRFLSSRTGVQRLKDLAASKNILVAMGWTLITALPIVTIARPRAVSSLAAAAALLAATWLRSLLFDLVDASGDRLAGRETIPTVFGIERSARAARLAATGLGLWLACCSIMGWMPPSFAVLGLAVALEAVLPGLTRRLGGLWAQAALDSHFIAAALIVELLV